MKQKFFATFLFLFTLCAINAQGVWNRKADFSGMNRKGAVGFSVGAKGYIGTGRDENRMYKDFWEYDTLLNAWTQKADFGGTARMKDRKSTRLNSSH